MTRGVVAGLTIGRTGAGKPSYVELPSPKLGRPKRDGLELIWR